MIQYNWTLKKTCFMESNWNGRKSWGEIEIERLEILTWPYLITRMGSYDFPIFSVKVKSKWKTCWSLCL